MCIFGGLYLFFQMTFGEQNTEKEAHEILSYATERGINALDTAEAVSSFFFFFFHNNNSHFVGLGFIFHFENNSSKQKWYLYLVVRF